MSVLSGYRLVVISPPTPPPPTDPDIPQDFEVSSWNSSSISLAWSCPENLKYSLFLLTVFYLNGTDHVIGEVPVWHKKDNFVFTLSDLEPCNRVKFGLQTVCLAGLEHRCSKMVLNDGNSGKSSMGWWTDYTNYPCVCPCEPITQPLLSHSEFKDFHVCDCEEFFKLDWIT